MTETASQAGVPLSANLTDLAARFGFELTAAGKRTCIVIIELELDDFSQRIGLVVDAVDAVLSSNMLSGSMLSETTGSRVCSFKRKVPAIVGESR